MKKLVKTICGHSYDMLVYDEYQNGKFVNQWYKRVDHKMSSRKRPRNKPRA